MSPYTIRPAADSDGQGLYRLYQESNHADHGVDWARAQVGGWWLVAEEPSGHLGGAIQVIPSQPFGYVGDFVVHPAHRVRHTDNGGALTVRMGDLASDLLVTAFVVLREAGVQLVIGGVGSDLLALQRIYKWYGSMDLGTFTLLARRLA